MPSWNRNRGAKICQFGHVSQTHSWILLPAKSLWLCPTHQICCYHWFYLLCSKSSHIRKSENTSKSRWMPGLPRCGNTITEVNMAKDPPTARGKVENSSSPLLPVPCPIPIPCTDGGDELHSGCHFGFHCHDVEVHEIVESQMKHTVVWKIRKRAARLSVKHIRGQARWCTYWIPALGRQRQGDL